MTAETTGRVTYGSHYSLADRLVKQYDAISKDTQSIRNAMIVKYQRIGETLTLPLTSLTGGSGAPIVVTVENDSAFVRSLLQMEAGQSFKVTDSTDADANGTFTLLATPTANILTSAQNVSGAVSATTGCLQSEFIRYKTAFAANTTSIARYGLRQAAVYEASSGNIDTRQEARSLARVIVSDLSEPTADVSGRVSCAPWFELHDLLTLQPDARQRWTANLDVAITSVNHHLDGAASYTSLSLRSGSSSTPSISGAVPTGGTGWGDRIRVTPTRPGLVDRNGTEVDLDIIGPQLGGEIGRQISMPTKPPFFQGHGGRRRLRNDYMEVHLSTDASFIPDETTLAHAGRGT